MLRLKSLIPAAAVMTLGLVAAGYAQEDKDVKAKEIVYEKPNEFQIFAAGLPTKAFVVQGTTLWCATEVALFMQPLTAAKTSQQKFDKMGDISSRGITGIVADSKGQVWIGGEEGVAMRSGSSFTTYTSANGLPDDKILCVAAAGSEVWVGTEKGAARFRDGSWTKFTKDQGLPSNTVQAIVADSKGKIYLGTKKGGLSVYNGTEFKNYNSKNTGAEGIEWNDVRVLAVEPNRDVIWMIDGPEGNINSFDGKKWERFFEIQKGVTSIMNDTRRTWFGHEGGIIRWNGDEWVSEPDRLGVPAMQVFSMWRDASGNLWFGMEKGVMRLTNPYRK